MTEVSLSRKLGIASLVLMAAFIILPFNARSFPLGSLFGIASVVLGVLAGRRGSKWWLVVPSAIVLFVAFIATFLVVGPLYHLSD